MARNRCKEHLLETATMLFNKNGFHATGIDTIIDEADVSRMSLYYNFASKDALIEAVLARHDESIEAWTRSILKSGATPQERLDKLFDELGSRWNCEEFHGCPFVNAVAEYSCIDHPVHQAAIRHKSKIKELLVELLSQMKLLSTESAADQIMLVIDGGGVRAQIFGDKKAHMIARDAARAIVAAAEKSS